MDYRSALAVDQCSSISLDQEHIDIDRAFRVINQKFRPHDIKPTIRGSGINDILHQVHEDTKRYWAQFGFMNSSKRQPFASMITKLLTVREFKNSYTPSDQGITAHIVPPAEETDVGTTT